MRKRFACIIKGMVIEIIAVEESMRKELEPKFDQIIEIKDTDGFVDKGYAYDGTYFYEPSKGVH